MKRDSLLRVTRADRARLSAIKGEMGRLFRAPVTELEQAAADLTGTVERLNEHVRHLVPLRLALEDGREAEALELARKLVGRSG